MAKKKTASKSAQNRPHSGGRKKKARKGVQVRTMSLSNSTVVTCASGGGAGMPCRISASGTLQPPMAGLDEDNLSPAAKANWELLDATSGSVLQGPKQMSVTKDIVSGKLKWSVPNSATSPVSCSGSYTFRVIANWMIPTSMTHETAFKCPTP